MLSCDVNARGEFGVTGSDSLLVVDLGNSEAKIARFEGDTLIRVARVPTRRLADLSTPESLLHENIEPQSMLDGSPPVALGSVVSWAGAKLAALFTGLGCAVTPLTSLDDFGLRINYEHGEPGVDRTAAASAAYQRSGGPLILVGCGTALHTNVVTKDGVYLGGAIMPGLRLMTEALSAGADQLGRVYPVVPTKAVGSSTPDCIRIGIYHCWIGGALRLIEETKKEVGEDAALWLTGGQSEFLLPFFPEAHIDGNLTLSGLKAAYGRHISILDKE